MTKGFLRRIRNFVSALFDRPTEAAPRHGGHELADEVREGMGTLGGGAAYGGMTGSAVYKHFEERVESSEDH